MTIHLSFYSIHAEIRLVIQNAAGKYLPFMSVRDVFIIASWLDVIAGFLHHWLRILRLFGRRTDVSSWAVWSHVVQDNWQIITIRFFNKWFSQHEPQLYLALASKYIFCYEYDWYCLAILKLTYYFRLTVK